MTSDAIKTMKLYDGVGRVHQALAAEGFGPGKRLPLAVLTRHDQLHYFGTTAVDEAIAVIGPPVGGDVLDIGAGYGGPARYFADRTGTTWKEVELQPDLHEAATDLTERAVMKGRVRHVCGDIMTVPLDPDTFDGAISYLALYHVPDRAPLFPRLLAALKPGSAIYIEDLYARQPFDVEEARLVRDALFGNTLADRDGYIDEITRGGFVEVELTDMSGPWGRFCTDRLAAFRAARAEKVAIHGAETVQALETFYDVMCRLFDGGRLGGARVTARKPV